HHDIALREGEDRLLLVREDACIVLLDEIRNCGEAFVNVVLRAAELLVDRVQPSEPVPREFGYGDAALELWIPQILPGGWLRRFHRVPSHADDRQGHARAA